MKEPSLKWVLIAVITGLTVFLLTFNSYTNLLVYNNATMNNNYTIKYTNISNYQKGYENWGEGDTLDSIIDIPGKFLSTFLTAVNVGMSVLGNLFTTLIGTKEIIRIFLLDPDFKDFTIIIGLLLTIFTIYLVYRLLGEIRGVTPG